MIAEPLSQEPTSTEDCAGAMIGPYRVLECIGDGGMGRVYRAEHVELGRPAAIKFLLPHYAADPEAASRFMLEAKAVNMARHANLVDIYDVFVDPQRGVRAYVMELLSGWSLRDAMMQGPLDLRTTLSITRQIASALHAAHSAGVVHRDIKPENIYLCAGASEETTAKVLDFGVAKFTRGNAPFQTGAGMAVGSPWYMAPEQASQRPVTHLADVYSLGVLLYEMLTGCVPFTGHGYTQVLEGHLTKEPPPLRRRDGGTPPSPISVVVLRCLEKDPAARPAGMAALWDELAEAAGPMNAPSRVLIPPLGPVPVESTSASATAAVVPSGAHPPDHRRAAMRRLAALSFTLGLVGGLAVLSALAAPGRGAEPVTRRNPAVLGSEAGGKETRHHKQRVSRTRRARKAAATAPPEPAPEAAAVVEWSAPEPVAFAGEKEPKRRATKRRSTKRRSSQARRTASQTSSSSRSSRWSRAAFDKKRSSAQRGDDR